MKPMQRKSIAQFVMLFLSGILIIAIGVFASQVQFANKDSSALYGGQDEKAYPSAGYLIAYEGVQPQELCGALIIGANRAVSAAHCVTKGSSFLIGKENFSVLPTNKLTIKNVYAHPNWDNKRSNFDVALLELQTDQKGEIATVATPKRSCDYRIVAYGRTERDTQNLSLERSRKSADICVTLIENDVVYVNSRDGGICVGDSGSPIFEKNTNNVIGIVSAIIVNNNEDPCFVGNTGIAVRLDTKNSFVRDEFADLKKTTPGIDTGDAEQEFARVTVATQDQFKNIWDQVSALILTNWEIIAVILVTAGLLMFVFVGSRI